jgi:hypothetical protein
MAQLRGASLTLLHVIRPRGLASFHPVARIENVMADEYERGDLLLAVAAEMVRGAPAVRTELQYGIPAAKIC